MIGKVFQCESCGGTFTSTSTEEEKVSELEENFPGSKTEDCVTVCDTCYQYALQCLGLK